MNILVTLDANYLNPLKVMLWSLFFQHPGQRFHIYLMHASIPEEELSTLRGYIEGLGQSLTVLTVQEDWFANAPVLLHYTKAMYYRLLAYKFLPAELDRILYLDPDILIVNPIDELYNTSLDGYLYAAVYHNKVSRKEVNRLRLKTYDIKEYFNSGVLLMNLALQREKINEEEIYSFIIRCKNRLICPDQDVLNALYGRGIKTVDEFRFNYDTRFYQYNKLLRNGALDAEYIMRNTSILHFCGKKKPWQKNYAGVFHALYLHYQNLAFRNAG